MRVVAIILILFVFKAGTALPISTEQLIELQSNTMEMTVGVNSDTVSCCNDHQEDEETGCCDAGHCCCIQAGAQLMTAADIYQPHIKIPALHALPLFAYAFSYTWIFNPTVFQPPRAI